MLVYRLYLLLIGGMEIVELNEGCRFLCYLPGQNFPAHRDGTYLRPAAKGNIIDSKGINRK